MRIERVESEAGYEETMVIRREVFVQEQGVSLALEVDPFTPDMSVFIVRDEDGRAVATGRYRIKGRLAKFERIATLASERGRGAGSALVAAMVADARHRFPTHLPFMHAQEGAFAFYATRGWMAVGPSFVEAGIPHRAMMLMPSDPERAALLADSSLPKIVLDALAKG